MRLQFKKLLTLFSNRIKYVDAVQTWEVRWRSRDGDYSGDTRPEIEVFADEKTAREFAESLRLAFELIRHTSGNRVDVKRAK